MFNISDYLNIINKNCIGVSISDYSIEIVNLQKNSSEIGVVKLERAILESGIVVRGHIVDATRLAEVFNGLYSCFNIEDKIIFALPESLVHVNNFYFDLSRNHDCRTIVKDELEKVVPINKDKLLFDYKKLGTIKNKDKILTVVLSVSVNIEDLSEWDKFFNENKAQINLFDMESFANYRWFFYKKENRSLMLLDLGAETSNLSIFTDLGMEYNHAYNFAGINISRKIADKKQIDVREAEELKKRIGLKPESEDEKEVADLIRGCIDQIVDVVNEGINNFKEKYFRIRNIKEIVLLGGSADIKGLVEYLNTEIKEFEIKKALDSFSNKDTSLYQVAIGSALRGFDNKWEKTDPKFVLEKRKKRFNNQKLFSFIGLSRAGNFFQYYRKTTIKVLWFMLIATILIGGTRIFLNNDNQENDIVSEYKINNIIYFELPLIINSTNNELENKWGRLVETSEYSGEAGLLGQAQLDIKSELEEEDVLYEDPVKVENNGSAHRYSFVVYNKELLKEYIATISKSLLGNKEVTVSNIEIKQLTQGRENTYIAKGRVDMELEIGESIEKIVPANIERYKRDNVIVKDIGTALNVRKGPGTSYIIVDRIESGDIVPMLEDNGAWIKIELQNNKEGWVYAEYVEKENY